MTNLNLQAGDVLLYVPNFKKNWIGFKIAQSENDIEAHASIYIGSNKVLEALKEGVTWNVIEDSIKEAKEVKVYRYTGLYKPTEQELLTIISKGKYDSKKYNFLNLASQFFYIKTGAYIGSKENKHAVICSVLCAKIWNDLKIGVCEKPWTFTPSSWSKYYLFTCVGFLK